MRTERVDQPVIFDTDCLSAFAAFPSGIGIIAETLGGVWTTSHAVGEFASAPDSIYINVHSAQAKGTLGVYDIFVGDPAMQLFRELTAQERTTVMGDGEAAAVALVSTMGGTVASNNLKDIRKYCTSRNVPFICSDDILSLAVLKNVITLQDACSMWNQMKSRRYAILPKYDFHEAFKRFREDKER